MNCFSTFPSHIRFVLAGSGGFFNVPYGAEMLLEQAKLHVSSGESSSSTASPRVFHVAYIGTASYDLPQDAERQVSGLAQLGCRITPIEVADPGKECLSSEEEKFLVEKADIILVSGGNTLYAIRRWEATGVARTLRYLIDPEKGPCRKVVLAGGSAGSICWCTSGHSDSSDPSTFVKPSLLAAMGREDEIDEESKSLKWDYIRVTGLGVLSCMLCPHYDATGSNGVEREEDFKQMLKRHPTERGLAIDHWAALVLYPDPEVPCGKYEVRAIPGKGRQCDSELLPLGSPGVYTLDVVQAQATGGSIMVNKVEVKPAAPTGPVDALLRPPTGPLVRDPFEAFFAISNTLSDPYR